MRLPDGVAQREVMQDLLDRGIATRRAVMNSHLEPAYAPEDTCRAGSCLERSVAAQNRAIMLPLYVQMSDADVDFVVDTLAGAIARSGRN